MATLLPPGQAGGFDRCLDALIGGAVGVRWRRCCRPIRSARSAARPGRCSTSWPRCSPTPRTRCATRDVDAARAVLRRARASQSLIDTVRAALRDGREITRVAPLFRRRRGELGRYTELAERADYAMRNARVLARRTYSALADDEPAAPELADALGELAAAVGVLTAQLGRDGDRERARAPVLEVVRHAKVLAEDWQPGPSEAVIVAQLSSIALDLLQATGMTRADALAAMRERG